VIRDAYADDPKRVRPLITLGTGAAGEPLATWTCPLCSISVGHQIRVVGLAWAANRARMHMRTSHGYSPIPGWRPPPRARQPRMALAAASSAREATVITLTGPGRPRGHVVPPLAG